MKEQMREAWKNFLLEKMRIGTSGEAIFNAGYQAALSAVPANHIPDVGKMVQPTDISKQLREYAADSGYSHNDYADTMLAAASEIERYYGGMLAWKKTAETKDLKLSQEIESRISERCAARLEASQAQQPAQEQIEPKLSQRLIDTFQELNMGNYGDDDVRQLNDWAIEAYTTLADIAQQPAQEPLSAKPDYAKVHLAHCFTGEYEGCCKYGEDDTCPAQQPAQEPVSHIGGSNKLVQAVNALAAQTGESPESIIEWLTDKGGLTQLMLSYFGGMSSQAQQTESNPVAWGYAWQCKSVGDWRIEKLGEGCIPPKDTLSLYVIPPAPEGDDK